MTRTAALAAEAIGAAWCTVGVAIVLAGLLLRRGQR